jgi:hypothetical protein
MSFFLNKLKNKISELSTFMEITNWVVSPIFENLFFNLSIYNSDELFVEPERCADVKK